MKAIEPIDGVSLSTDIARGLAEHVDVARVAVEAMSAMAGVAVADPLGGADPGVVLSQGWSDFHQQGHAVVAGDMRSLTAQTGQTVAARLSASSPIETGRIERALADFARDLRAHAAERPHLTTAQVVEPLLRALASDRASFPAIARNPVERFLHLVEIAREDLRRS